MRLTSHPVTGPRPEWPTNPHGFLGGASHHRGMAHMTGGVLNPPLDAATRSLRPPPIPGPPSSCLHARRRGAGSSSGLRRRPPRSHTSDQSCGRDRLRAAGGPGACPAASPLDGTGPSHHTASDEDARQVFQRPGHRSRGVASSVAGARNVGTQAAGAVRIETFGGRPSHGVGCDHHHVRLPRPLAVPAMSPRPRRRHPAGHAALEPVLVPLSGLRYRVYVRSSTLAQDESCEQQLRCAEIDLRKLGLLAPNATLPRTHAPWAGVYVDDGVSAWQVPLVDRPAGKQLLEDLAQDRRAKKQSGVLWVWAQSRLVRPEDGAPEAVAQVYHVALLGWKVHSHRQGDLDVIGKDGLAKTISVALNGEKDAEHSREKADAVRRVKRNRVLNGVWLGGEAPYGYERWAAEFTPPTPDGRQSFTRWIRLLPPGEQNGITGALTLLRPSATASLIAEMFRLAADGEDGHVVSIDAIRRRLEQRTGKEWARTTVNMMLVNPVYMARQHDEDGALQPAIWEPVVDAVTWERVQRRLKNNASQRRGVNTEFSLSGLVFCARCGERMNGERAKRLAHLGGYIDYYRSSRPHSDARACPSCRGRVRAEAIEQRVLEVIAGLADQPLVQRALMAEQAAMREGSGSVAVRRAALENRAATLRQSIDNVLAVVEQGGEVAKRAMVRSAELNHEVNEVQRELDALDHGAETVKAFVNAAATFQEVWAHAAPAERKEALRCFVSRVEVDGEQKRVRIGVLPLRGVSSAPREDGVSTRRRAIATRRAAR